MSVFDTLTERGFIQQTTHEEQIKELLSKESVTFYTGFDPTADSLHIGHFVPVMAMSHMQRAGHRPIVLVGGGTGMVGDTTDRTDMRQMMTRETVEHNVARFKQQFSKFLDFEDGKALIIDNAEWLLQLNYISFIREYGIHFSVNKMLTADTYRTRFEKGLSFFEFNYLLMQSYDFLELNRRFNCRLQFGGNDQWSNILGGVDLIRRADQKEAFGMTFSLLTTSDGNKMGKTKGGAIWLDPEKTSPYDFYQYWRNVADADVINCLKLLTYLSMEEIDELAQLQGSDINRAKEILAFEVTKIIHNEDEAQKAQVAARSLFGGNKNAGSIPSMELPKSDFQNGLPILQLLEKVKLIPSRAEGRRLIQQGGIKINDVKIDSIERSITLDDFQDGSLLIQKGKKTFYSIYHS